LEQEIAQRNQRLAATVDEIVERLRPREMARRGATGVARRLGGGFRTPDGQPRVERVAAVLVAVLLVLAVAGARALARRRR
jgi:hypothetical protein